MSYKIAVIGAGWYGCHIAVSLQSLGFEVVVFEQHDRPLHEASGNNQFRLHLGFHYPRHHGTRVQSRDGFMRFIERYPELAGPIEQNFYAVPEEDSLIDFLTYRLIMTSSGINFTELSETPMFLKNIQGVLQTGERVLYVTRARAHFVRRLGAALVTNHKINSVSQEDHAVYVDGDRYDYVVDATWGHFSRPPTRVFYEPTMLIYYEARESFPAVTLVDGPLCAVYPTEDPATYTLSSVVHTPLGQFADADLARQCQNRVTSELVTGKVAAMEEQMRRYIPNFKDHFRFLGPQVSIKTKPVGSEDDRSCQVFQEGRIFSVLSGKIDTIFFAVERILSFIQASHGSEFDGYVSSFGAEIRTVV